MTCDALRRGVCRTGADGRPSRGCGVNRLGARMTADGGKNCRVMGFGSVPAAWPGMKPRGARRAVPRR